MQPMKTWINALPLAILLSGYTYGQSTFHALINGRIYTGTSVIEQGFVTFSNGVIQAVGSMAEWPDTPPSGARIIDVSGQYIYPGFMALDSRVGLTEIDAVRATRDFAEVGSFNPHVRSLIAYNTDSRIIETIRTNGVLIVQPAPTTGILSGQSSVMRLSGHNWEEAVLKADDGFYLNWPEAIETTGWWAEPGDDQKNEKYLHQTKEIEEYLSKARAYALDPNPPYDVKLSALKSLFTDPSRRLYIRARRAREIKDALHLCSRLEIARPVISGAWEADLVADLLRQTNTPVILDRLTRLPDSKDEHVHKPYYLPAILDSLGITFAFSYTGSMEAMGTRNLPFTAGMATGYGLSELAAIKAISANPAKIAGLDHYLGTIAPGKAAILFVNPGNALEMLTNNPSYIFILGEEIPTTNFQTDLYHHYLKRYQLD